MADLAIRPTKNGPLIIEGPIDLFDTEGNKLAVAKPRLALWRFIEQAFLRRHA